MGDDTEYAWWKQEPEEEFEDVAVEAERVGVADLGWMEDSVGDNGKWREGQKQDWEAEDEWHGQSHGKRQKVTDWGGQQDDGRSSSWSPARSCENVLCLF